MVTYCYIIQLLHMALDKDIITIKHFAFKVLWDLLYLSKIINVNTI